MRKMKRDFEENIITRLDHFQAVVDSTSADYRRNSARQSLGRWCSSSSSFSSVLWTLVLQ